MNKKIFFTTYILFSLLFTFLVTKVVLAEEEIIPDPVILTANVFIRSGEDVVYDGVINLPEEGVVNILSSDGENHEINSRSVLSVLQIISQESEPPFIISDLQYYSSFGSLYLKCITPNNKEELCDNWQYVVNGVTPYSGIDQTVLTGDEDVALYFGTPHQLILDKNEIEEGGSIIVNSEKYNYIDNTWGILSGININVTILNEEDPWNPTVISETAVDENGVALITINTEGIYTFGIKEDYSFPSYQVVVSKASGGGGGGGGSSDEIKEFSVEDALSFLLANQEDDGSFGDDLYTDWVAIGIAKTENNFADLKNKIYDYLKNNTFESSITTDNERHAMALLAFNINPSIDTEINYIEKIISSFDGVQIGDDSLYNDDIFGLIILQKVGYTENDEIIEKVIKYIIEEQSSNGSWESVDMTSAAIMALHNFNNVDGVSESIDIAQNYLIESQNQDGGFGNSFSTSWAIQALSLNNSFDDEILEAIEYLAFRQHSDGGLDENMDIESRIWATSYAIPAVSILSWNEILESFEKEESESTDNTESSSDGVTNEDLKEEVIKIPEPVVVELKTDVVKEEIKEIPQKIVKKENIINDELKIKELEKVEMTDNLLGASAYQTSKINEDNHIISSLLKVLENIVWPLNWFWTYIGSLL